jgi:sugar/nucleoside kinase (ribokinase family)
MEAGVLCYGELGVDNLIRVPHLPSPEQAAFPVSESYQVGGAAANSAVWLARWEVPVRLAGNHIGQDEYGLRLLGWLRRYPSLSLEDVIQADDVVTPFCRVMVTPDGERTFLVYWYPGTPKTPLTTEMLRGCAYLALDLYGGGERAEAARVARAAGVRTVVGDVIWPDHDVLPLADIATNSAAFIRETFPGADVRRHARELHRIGEGIVVTTDGPRPIHVIGSQGSEFSVQPPHVQPIDATGAGDAFRSGLIFGLLHDWPLERCVCFGAAAGAFSVQQEGSASAPVGATEVEALASTLRAEPVSA